MQVDCCPACLAVGAAGPGMAGGPRVIPGRRIMLRDNRWREGREDDLVNPLVRAWFQLEDLAAFTRGLPLRGVSKALCISLSEGNGHVHRFKLYHLDFCVGF
jgi:hypothetical protein